ncbi:MAG: leucine-rich repeat domain-containing protein [Bacteroidales bacterium]|nr:leucine-rich repeat domain-containing protein [Bacteroidales bacterium]OQA84192.1 MAG: Leucine Rich repeats (2 copies) [Bacteroidetes bacterium ADurb.Bin234]
MKKVYVITVLVFISGIVEAQLLDSAALSKETMYKSLDQAKNVHPDSVLRLSLKWKKTKNLGMELSKYKYLQELHLNRMRLDEIPSEVFQLTNLVILDLSNNRLVSIPAEIGNLVNLTHLTLSQNYLIEIPPTFKHLKKLEYLDIWSNSIITFPYEMSELKETLRMVDMRVIYMNDLRKEDLQKLLPKTTFLFSESCNCN